MNPAAQERARALVQALPLLARGLELEQEPLAQPREPPGQARERLQPQVRGLEQDLPLEQAQPGLGALPCIGSSGGSPVSQDRLASQRVRRYRPWCRGFGYCGTTRGIVKDHCVA